jgi:hypothetical protein
LEVFSLERGYQEFCVNWCSSARLILSSNIMAN